MGISVVLRHLAVLPVTPDEDEARSWAERELSQPRYAEAQPSVLDRIAQAVAEAIGRLFSAPLPGDWTPWVAVVAAVVALVVIVAAFAIWGRPRRMARVSTRTEMLFDEVEHRSAAQLRAEAASCAQRREWDEAIVLRFRALARGLFERGAVDLPPGATVHAFARAAARSFPAFAADLESAAATFDDVRYLRRPGTAAVYRRVTSIDDAVAATRPDLAEIPA